VRLSAFPVRIGELHSQQNALPRTSRTTPSFRHASFAPVVLSLRLRARSCSVSLQPRYPLRTPGIAGERGCAKCEFGPGPRTPRHVLARDHRLSGTAPAVFLARKMSV
jgi:hypothetical protein